MKYGDFWYKNSKINNFQILILKSFDHENLIESMPSFCPKENFPLIIQSKWAYFFQSVNTSTLFQKPAHF